MNAPTDKTPQSNASALEQASPGIPSVVAPSDAETAALFCDSLSETIDALIAVLDEESHAIRTAKLDSARALHAKKSALSARYSGAMMALQTSPDALRDYAQDRLDSLRRRQEGLEDALQTNMTVLATARTVAETLIRSVHADAVQTSTKPVAYGADARTAAPMQRSTAIQVNAAI